MTNTYIELTYIHTHTHTHNTTSAAANALPDWLALTMLAGDWLALPGNSPLTTPSLQNLFSKDTASILAVLKKLKL